MAEKPYLIIRRTVFWIVLFCAQRLGSPWGELSAKPTERGKNRFRIRRKVSQIAAWHRRVVVGADPYNALPMVLRKCRGRRLRRPGGTAYRTGQTHRRIRKNPKIPAIVNCQLSIVNCPFGGACLPWKYACTCPKNKKSPIFMHYRQKTENSAVIFMQLKVLTSFTTGVLCARMLITFFELISPLTSAFPA